MRFFFFKPTKSLAAILSLLVLTFFCALLTAAFHPGHINADAVHQIAQGRSGYINDWHPPLFAYMWGILEKVSPVVKLPILLQMILTSCAVYICFRHWFSNVISALGTIIVLSLPWVLGYTGSLVKDVPYAAACLLLVGIGLHLHKWGKSRTKLIFIGIVAALLAAFIIISRYNAIVVVPFGLAFFSIQTARSLNLNFGTKKFAVLCPLMAFSALFLFTLLFVIGYIVFENKVIKPVRYHPVQQVLYYDITALSLAKEEVLLPSDYFTEQNIATMRSLFYPGFALTLITEFTGKPEAYPLLTDKTKVAELKRIWLESVLENPRMYLESRWECYKVVMTSHHAYHPGIDENNIGMKISNPRLNNVLQSYLKIFKDTILYNIWTYTWICGAGLIFLLGYYFKTGIHYFWIPLVPLANQGSLFLSAPAADYRLSWITPLFATTGLIIAIMLIGQRTWLRIRSSAETNTSRSKV